MAISRDINNLVINKVENQQVYDYMVQNNLINNDELYLIQGENEGIIQSDLSQTDSTAPDYVKGVIRQESLPEGYPYKTGMTIEWDGNTDGRYSLMGTYYHVSDEILSNNVLKNSTYITNHGTIVRCDLNWDVMELNGLINDDFAIVGEQDIIVVRKAGMTFGNDVCEKTGTYFLRTDLGVSPGLVYIANLSTEETIHTIAPEYLPESVTAQPDWNQNNNTAPDYVKNRPFYYDEEILGETLELDEMITESGDLEDIPEGLSYFNLSGNAWGSDSIYPMIVIFDKMEYECYWYSHEGLGWIGNCTLLGATPAEGKPNNEPFCIMINGSFKMFVTTAEAGTHSLYIKSVKQNITQIDEKFIPDSIARVGDIGGMPSVTTSDNGKFLRVVDGVWAAASITNAEEVSF